MLNILELIPSKTIREHLKKLDYRFGFLDAVSLIQYQEDLTLEQKHKMYLELKDMYTNEIVTFQNVYGYGEVSSTTRDIIDNLIKRDNESIENLKVNKENQYIYYYKILGDGSDGKRNEAFDDTFYSTYDKCFDAMKEDFDKFKKNAPDSLEVTLTSFVGFKKVDEIIIIRRKLNTTDDKKIYFNDNLDVVDVSYTVNVADIPEDENLDLITPQFCGDVPAFPLPFKDKDLVCYNYDPENVILLSKSVYGEYATEHQKADNSAMAYNEIMLDEKGEVTWLSHDQFEYGWTADWIKLEYFKGDLAKNKEKIDKLYKADDEYRKNH